MLLWLGIPTLVLLILILIQLFGVVENSRSLANELATLNANFPKTNRSGMLLVIVVENADKEV